MSVIWIPNVSEGRDPTAIAALVEAVSSQAVRVLDVHSDPEHHRSVITATGGADALVRAAVALAERAAELIDLRVHRGTHPCLGALDVCPFVPHQDTMEAAVALARETGDRIHEATGLPVYLYGEAATRAEARELPSLRRGGLATLAQRAEAELPPDFGSAPIDAGSGVVCVGARGPLIAFNVWIEAPVDAARSIAAAIRGPAVRALGMQMRAGLSQVSMNLIDPATVGIDQIFERIEIEAGRSGATIAATEIVGLAPGRFLPDPDAGAARLLREPGRSLESELAN